MSLKIIFDVSIIAESHQNPTGLARVADELLKRLSNSEDIILFYSLYPPIESRVQTKYVEKYVHKLYKTEAANIRTRIPFLPFRKEKPIKRLYRKYGISDYRNIDLPILDEGQIFHTPFYPITKNIQEKSHLKKVITIHDLIPIILPEVNNQKMLLEEIIDSGRKDAYYICVSENTKKDLLNYAPDISPERVFVSLLAADQAKFYKCFDQQKFKLIQSQYQLPQRYFLSVSTLEPRKNIPHLIKCFVKLITENNIQDLSLVLVGRKGWDYDEIFKEYKNSDALKSRIIFTSFIPDEDLAAVYSNAEAFFYLSLYEGFGLPPLEAMQCGVPTIASDTSSLPEVVGKAGILLNPKDEVSLVSTMLQLYQDEELRKEYSRKSLEQAAKFSWDKTVEQYKSIYKKILTTN